MVNFVERETARTAMVSPAGKRVSKKEESALTLPITILLSIIYFIVVWYLIFLLS